MSLDDQLESWTAAGLITVEQAERIAAFEKQTQRPWFLMAVAGLGAFAIAVGLVSIVAANWDEIPDRLKLALDLVLVALLGAAVVRFERRGPSWAFETAIVVLYGLVLASIALIGQVYQLGGRTHVALTVWVALTLVLMSRGRSRMSALLWLIGVQATLGSWLLWLSDRRVHDEALLVGSAIAIPFATLALAQVSRLRAVRPVLAQTAENIGWAQLVIGSSFATLAFYAEANLEQPLGMLAPLLVSGALTATIALRLPATPARAPARWLLVACLLTCYAAIAVPGDLDLLAAGVFIGLWILVALCAHRQGDLRVLNLATAIIGVRILFVYFEVFGSLLDTGIGLITGGGLTLLAVWLWDRKRRQFREELAKEAGR